MSHWMKEKQMRKTCKTGEEKRSSRKSKKILVGSDNKKMKINAEKNN